jgi:glycosyltransferase involved in cell wall biosynthesis
LWCLPEALASCPRSERIEIIVVDDGSTDGTGAWLELQAGITVISQDNWGKPAAANAGFAAATGTYIKFLDSDDMLIGDSVIAQLNFALAHRPDICVAGYEACYSSRPRIPHPWHDCGDFLAQQLGECDSSHYAAYLFRREFLSDVRHRPEFAFRDDRMFVLECALKMPRVLAWDQPTLLHIHHDRPRIQFQPGSTAVVTNWQERQMFLKVYALLDKRGLLSDRRKAAMSNNIWALALRISAYNVREGRALIAWLRSFNPQFEIPKSGLNRLYRTLGFQLAQLIVNTARKVRNSYRNVRSFRV